MTNYEYIKNMNIDEVADLLVIKCIDLTVVPMYCALPLNKFYALKNIAIKDTKKWLEKERDTQ
jgi:hypothetical protein